MMLLLDLAVGLARSWAATYTRGLPSELRAERRGEIDCDLWEHQRLGDFEGESVPGTAATILLRLFLGIPADIGWRIEAGASARSERGTHMKESGIMKALFWVCLVMLLLIPAYSVRIVANNGLEGVIAAVVPLIGGAVIATGLMTVEARPQRAVVLTGIGSLMVIVGWFWMFPITIPVGVGLTAYAYKRSRRFIQTANPAPA